MRPEVPDRRRLVVTVLSAVSLSSRFPILGRGGVSTPITAVPNRPVTRNRARPRPFGQRAGITYRNAIRGSEHLAIANVQRAIESIPGPKAACPEAQMRKLTSPLTARAI